MRVLFIGFNRHYVNRTFSVLLRAIQANHEVDFFGPGFQDTQTLDQGPSRWIEGQGPYDIVLFDSYTFEHDAVSTRRKPFSGDCLDMQPREFFVYGPALREFVRRYDGPKVFIANWDVYAITERRVNELEESGAYICDGSFSKLTVAEKEDTFNIELRGKFLTKGFIGGRPTDHWVNFVRARSHMVVEIPHAIGLEQTSFTPLRGRPNRFVVPGTNYLEREGVYQFLTMRQRAQQLKNRVRDALYSRSHRSVTPEKLRELHSRYDGSIAGSRMAYASGGPYRSPVRKYFEIPALGAAPVGQVVEGFAELGFADGVNFLVAETPTAVNRILREYTVDDAQKIATSARRLTIQKHSEPARARQLRESLRRISANAFAGSFWKDGEYHHR